MLRRLCWTLLLLPSLAAAESGYVAEATDLRDGPYADGKVLQSLAAASTVQIKDRQGGWYQVQVDQQQGWVRMSALRLRAPGARAGLLEGGREAATQSVATTGVRGFDDRDLQKATPDVPAADGLDAYAATSADATGFAAKAGLQANTKDKSAVAKEESP
ncbi:MAG: SH3 domain-containing protein [Nevskia sp.]|nr:SH3 domain-containing protein [Nevskia sp.]